MKISISLALAYISLVPWIGAKPSKTKKSNQSVKVSKPVNIWAEKTSLVELSPELEMAKKFFTQKLKRGSASVDYKDLLTKQTILTQSVPKLVHLVQESYGIIDYAYSEAKESPDVDHTKLVDRGRLVTESITAVLQHNTELVGFHAYVLNDMRHSNRTMMPWWVVSQLVQKEKDDIDTNAIGIWTDQLTYGLFNSRTSPWAILCNGVTTMKLLLNYRHEGKLKRWSQAKLIEEINVSHLSKAPYAAFLARAEILNGFVERNSAFLAKLAVQYDRIMAKVSLADLEKLIGDLQDHHRRNPSISSTNTLHLQHLTEFLIDLQKCIEYTKALLDLKEVFAAARKLAKPSNRMLFYLAQSHHTIYWIFLAQLIENTPGTINNRDLKIRNYIRRMIKVRISQIKPALASSFIVKLSEIVRSQVPFQTELNKIFTYADQCLQSTAHPLLVSKPRQKDGFYAEVPAIVIFENLVPIVRRAANINLKPYQDIVAEYDPSNIKQFADGLAIALTKVRALMSSLQNDVLAEKYQPLVNFIQHIYQQNPSQHIWPLELARYQLIRRRCLKASAADKSVGISKALQHKSAIKQFAKEQIVHVLASALVTKGAYITTLCDHIHHLTKSLAYSCRLPKAHEITQNEYSLYCLKKYIYQLNIIDIFFTTVGFDLPTTVTAKEYKEFYQCLADVLNDNGDTVNSDSTDMNAQSSSTTKNPSHDMQTRIKHAIRKVYRLNPGPFYAQINKFLNHLPLAYITDQSILEPELNSASFVAQLKAGYDHNDDITPDLLK
ncbi:hypothetical protein NEHOM01_0362 [Nematocida homosporus]|uniref:uncharacterized protein n=1 Tax=Nematocida homosporus TaxID=1912981 RepID=UPI00221F2D33|nr:uncharacterized protein NEHOM01_0362 [Nematocida homosporus]KAI5184760.1 hypothetical protein NEHOM01_0362 [Nematocida homosporus]